MCICSFRRLRHFSVFSSTDRRYLPVVIVTYPSLSLPTRRYQEQEQEQEQ